MHAITYLLKLQIDFVILDGHGQAYPGIPKEDFEIYISEKLLEFQSWLVDSLAYSDHFTRCIDF